MKTALPVLWTIDELDVVHTHRCPLIHETALDYLTVARTATALIEHLLRQDKANGHSAPSQLAHCDSCIGEMAQIEGASKP